MASTTNYSWSTPDNSGLVKNGAQDMRTLGDAIDTSVWNIGFGQAGKNKIINGDFSVNQRAFTSTTTTGTYMFDRFQTNNSGGTSTFTAQTFTLGTAPVAGYEGKNFLDVASTGQSAAADLTRIQQLIESVRTFAGQTVTVSFWAKAASGTPKVAVEMQQVFGSAGSPSAAVNTYFGQATLTTSWARYSVTASIPSISGKTLGTANDDRLSLNLYTSAGSNFNSRTGSLGIQTATISFWGIQAEYGSKATPFQLAGGGDPQAELAMCQRYYWRAGGDEAYQTLGTGITEGSTVLCQIINPVPMRTKPYTVDYSLLMTYDGVTTVTVNSASLGLSSKYISRVNVTPASAPTSYRPYWLFTNNSTSGYVGFNAEL